MKKNLIKIPYYFPSSKQITKSIKSLDPKVKKAIDLAYMRIHKFHSFQKYKIFLLLINLKISLSTNIYHWSL